MNNKVLLPVVLVIAAVIVAVVVIKALKTEPADRTTTATPTAAPAASQGAPSSAADPAPRSTGSVSIVQASGLAGNSDFPPALREAMQADTTRDEEARNVVLDAIDEATVTYSVEGLVVLGPLLNHPDPDIRMATIEGIVQLGETAGAKTLRDAARRARDPRDAKRMIEAAEFLELPEYQPIAAPQR